MLIASSGTALSNLAYLIGAVVVAVIAGVLVSLRHRPPKSVDANMETFRRRLDALAPTRSQSSEVPVDFKVTPVPPGALSKARLGPEYVVGPEMLRRPSEVARDRTGGQVG